MNQSTKSVLFLGLPYHKKTRSSLFFLNELRQKYDVTDYYVDLRHLIPEELAALAMRYYDFLMCWQVMPSPEFLECFQCGKVIMIPMLDHVMGMPGALDSLSIYREYLIICFSESMYLALKSRGYQVRFIQYYPEPGQVTEYGDTHSLFFWARTKAVSPDYILKRCSNLKLEKVHIHKAMDPGQEFHPVSDSHGCTITYSEWFPKKEDMERVMQQSALYAAPRLLEGIGMSFLGAMALGRCVIAPDLPTMNEYILNGKNGILYDSASFEPSDEFDIRAIQKATVKFMASGYRQWMSEKENLFRWIEE